VRITIAGVVGGAPGGPGAGLAGVAIPGVQVSRYLKVPQAAAGERAAATAYSFERQVPTPGSLANVAAYPPLARTFVTARPDVFGVRASAIAVPGPALDSVLASLTPARKDSLEVTASSTWGSLPGLAPANLFRSNHPGAWIAGAAKPVIRLTWQGRRTIRRMIIQPLPGFAAAPEAIKIISPQGTRDANVGLDGLTEIVPPLTTTQMSISFPVVQFTTTTQPVSGQVVPLPVGLSRLSIPALAGLRPATLVPGTRFALPCGSGPRITIDGRTLQTAVSGRVGGLIAFKPVRVRLCGADPALPLAAGRHWLTASRPGAFTITSLSLGGAGSGIVPAGALGQSTAAPQHDRPVRVLAWKQEYRQVRIGPGAAAYLELHQNASAGWTATMDGRTLAPVRLDGWQQGFIISAGSGGVVTLTFKPVKFYHVWIILSATGALGLLLVAVVRRRRRRAGDQMDRALPADPVLTTQARPVPDSPGSRLWPPAPAWLGVLALAVLIAVVGGPMVLAVPVLVVAANWWPRWCGGVAAVAMIASGVLAAIAAHPALAGTGAFGAPAQACALIALTAALVPRLPGWPGLPALSSLSALGRPEREAAGP
jgi:arabinofuranan 3-O-arabinosyltransferase